MSKRSARRQAAAAKSPTYHVGRGPGFDRAWHTLDELFGLGNAILRRIGEAEALQQGAVSAAIDVVSQDIAKAKLRLIEETPAGRRILTHRDHPLARRLALEPNPWMTWHEANEMVMRSLALHQNALFVKRRRSRDDIDPDLVPVHWGRVVREVTQDRVFYRVAAMTLGEQMMLGFTERQLGDDDVIHIRGRMHNGDVGLSTLAIGADVLGLNQALIDFQAGMAAQGLRPNAVITTPHSLSNEQFARLKTEIEGMLRQAIARGTPALLENGLKYEPIAMDAMKADLIKARQLARQEAAALFRVPAYKVGASETEKYDNKATAEQTYVDDCLVPFALRVEGTLSRWLLTQEERLAGLRLEFDRDDLYDRDRQAASDRIVKQYDAGIITRGQANVKLGNDPVAPELDTYKVGLNTAAVARDGTVTIFATPAGSNQPGAPPATPTDDENGGRGSRAPLRVVGGSQGV